MKPFIILIAILAVLAAVVPIIVGRQTFDGLADENAYERGLRWDAEQRARAEAGWTVSLRTDKIIHGENNLVFEIHDRQGSLLPAEKVSVRVTRPSSAAYDRIVEAAPAGDGSYRAVIKFPLKGHWDLQFIITHGRRTITLEEKIYATERS